MEASKYFLNINDLLYASLSEKLTAKQLESMFDKDIKWIILGYLAIPLLLYMKTHIIAGILGIGSFIFNRKISHKKLWNIVLKAETIFLLVIAVKILWFYFFQTDYTYDDVQNFYPLSLLSFIGYEEVAPWFFYPLQTINLFEVLYWIVLAFLIDRTLKERGNTGIKIVASSYGPALLIWVVAVMFLVLNFS